MPLAQTLLMVVASRGGAHARTESNLASWRLAYARLDDVAHEDLLYSLWLNSTGCESMLEGDDAKLGCGEALEGAVERTDWRTGRGDNHDVVGRGRLQNCQMFSMFIVKKRLTIFLTWFARRRVRVVAVEGEEVERTRSARASI